MYSSTNGGQFINNEFEDVYLVTTLDPIPLEAFTLQVGGKSFTIYKESMPLFFPTIKRFRKVMGYKRILYFCFSIVSIRNTLSLVC